MSDEELVDYADTMHTEEKTSRERVASFAELLLKDELIKAIRDANLEHPSAVQQQVIPKAMLGVDILCQAKSGTGKTVVFVLSALQRITGGGGHVQVLVIAHTKEMVAQIADEFRRFMAYTEMRVEMLFGGTDVQGDVERLRTPCDIVVGTPGRVYDMVERGALDVSGLRILVIDEIDSILSSRACRWTVQCIIYHTPVDKQTMLYTATLSEEAKRTCLLMLRKPFVLQVDEEKRLTLHGLEQGYINVAEEGKRDKLIQLIDSTPDISQCVVFCRDKRRVEALADHLQAKGVPTISITSDYGTSERMQRFTAFRRLDYRFLVTTNLMARGIDIAEINLVVNYDMAEDAQTYLHRVGRAGRFETRGTAISFISNEEDIVVLNEVQERFEVSIKEIK